MRIRFVLSNVRYVSVERGSTEYRAYFARLWQLPEAVWRAVIFSGLLWRLK